MNYIKVDKNINIIYNTNKVINEGIYSNIYMGQVIENNDIEDIKKHRNIRKILRKITNIFRINYDRKNIKLVKNATNQKFQEKGNQEKETQKNEPPKNEPPTNELPKNESLKKEQYIILKILNKKPLRKFKKKIETEIDNLVELEKEEHIIHIAKVDNKFIYNNRQFSYICFELCEGGDLFEYFVKKVYLTEEEIIKIIKQIIDAIKNCHKHNIIHGDIKLENIGLCNKDNTNCLKLLDFGSSYHFDPKDENKYDINVFNCQGTPLYLPPEIVCNKFLIKERELIYVDYWCLGILTYVLINGRFPFETDYEEEDKVSHNLKFKIIKEKVKWSKKYPVSNNLKLFVENLLRKKNTERLIDESLLD